MSGIRTTGRGVAARLVLTVGFLAAGLVVAVPVAAPSPARVAQPEPTYTNPRLDNDAATNPFILKVGSTYHAYFDGMAFGYVAHAISTDQMQTWTWDLVPPVLTSPGSWVDPAGTSVTSPSVVELSSTSYVMYFTGKLNGSTKRCIGVATATSARGPFTGTGSPLVCPNGAGDEAVEPSAVKNTLVPQLFYRQIGFQPGIYTMALEPTMLTPHASIGTPVEIFTAADAALWPEGQDIWKDGIVEDPSVAFPPGGGNPYLVFSGTDPVTGARHVGTVDCPGGWGFALVNDCDDVPLEGGRLIGSAAARTVGGTTYPGIVGPTGAEVVLDGTDQWLVYNADDPDCTTDCIGMYVDKLCFADGAPRTNAPTRTSELSRESNCAQDVPSDWMTTWATGLENGFFNLHPRFQDETWRQMVHAATGGSAVRVKLSNRGNTQPLTIDAASVAVADEQQDAATPSSRVDDTAASPITPLTFGGATAVTIPPGDEVYSDAAWLTIPDDHDVAVSVHIPTWPQSADPPSRTIRLVVGNAAAPTSADSALQSHFVGEGDVVTVVDDGDPDNDLGVTEAVIISPSVVAGTLGSKYRGSPVAVINLAAPTWQTQHLSSTSSLPSAAGTTGHVVAPTHRVAAGTTGTVALLSSSDTLTRIPQANLGAGAVRVWTTTSGSTDALAVAYDRRTQSAQGTTEIAGPRVAVGYSAGAVERLTTAGWDLLDAAVEWGRPSYGNMAGSSHGDETSFVGFGNLVSHVGGGPEFANNGGAGIQNVQFVASVEVLAASPRGTVVVVADSLTDGSFGLTGYDEESMWPTRLNDVLNSPGNPQRTSVINAAIIGNTLLNGDKTMPSFPVTDPMSVLGRFNRDVLSHAGVRTVFVEIGLNDLVGDPADNVPAGRSANDIMTGLDQLVDRADTAGLRVVAANYAPYAWRTKTGWGAPCYADIASTPVNEAVPTAAEQAWETQRLALNTRLTTPQAGDPTFDAVVDFNTALRWGTLTNGVDRPDLSHLGIDCIHVHTNTPGKGQVALAAAVPTGVLIP